MVYSAQAAIKINKIVYSSTARIVSRAYGLGIHSVSQRGQGKSRNLYLTAPWFTTRPCISCSHIYAPKLERLRFLSHIWADWLWLLALVLQCLENEHLQILICIAAIPKSALNHFCRLMHFSGRVGPRRKYVLLHQFAQNHFVLPLDANQVGSNKRHSRANHRAWNSRQRTLNRGLNGANWGGTPGS